MSGWFGEMLAFVAAALGLVTVPNAAALGLAIAVVAVLALTVAVALVSAPAGDRDRPHPLRAIDASVLLSQSDPDAAGHPRPRAPGVAVPA